MSFWFYSKNQLEIDTGKKRPLEYKRTANDIFFCSSIIHEALARHRCKEEAQYKRLARYYRYLGDLVRLCKTI